MRTKGAAMALIGYARVSTESQHVDLQKDALRKAARKKSGKVWMQRWPICAKVMPSSCGNSTA